MNRLHRKFKRAPVGTSCLFTYKIDDEEHVFKSQVLNISEGGMLLNDIPFLVAQDSECYCLFSIRQLNNFSSMAPHLLQVLDPGSIKNSYIRVFFKVIRGHDQHNVSDLIQNAIGCKFLAIEPASQRLISEYIEVATRNIVFILNQFEKSGNDPQNILFIRNLCRLMGIESQPRISDLHSKVLHEYRSLESA